MIKLANPVVIRAAEDCTGTGSLSLSAPFCPLANLLSPDQSGRWLVGAVGIELKATLKTRKLLIPLNEKNAKNTEFAQVRYTAGTRTLEGREGVVLAAGEQHVPEEIHGVHRIACQVQIFFRVWETLDCAVCVHIEARDLQFANQHKLPVAAWI